MNLACFDCAFEWVWVEGTDVVCPRCGSLDVIDLDTADVRVEVEVETDTAK
jgi:hypothetical protein